MEKTPDERVPSPRATRKESPGALVVDDEMALARLLQYVLQQAGFRVWLATGSQEAVDCYRRHQKEIDVVLLDVRMPECDGPTTLLLLRQLNPDVRCCFMSGYPDGYVMEDLWRLGVPDFIEKPFHIEDVVTRMHRIAQEAQDSG